MSGVDDTEETRRRFTAPYTPKNPIPTIQSYRREKEQRREEAGVSETSRTQEAINAYRRHKDGGSGDEQDPQHTTYYAENKNSPEVRSRSRRRDTDGTGKAEDEGDDGAKDPTDVDSDSASDVEIKDTSEAREMPTDPKERRKELKKRKGDRAEREVTDPVTHLPVHIHDFTKTDLDNVPENKHPTRVDSNMTDRSEEDLKKESKQLRETHSGMQNLFPPPQFDALRDGIANVQRKAFAVGLALIVLVLNAVVISEKIFGVGERIERALGRKNTQGKTVSVLIIIILGTGLTSIVLVAVTGWAERKTKDLWEGEVWEAERAEGQERVETDETPESAQWMNSLVASIWPLVNPDLFISLADTLEDVMQASLPRLVRMVSVDDIGQGSEAFRILGVRWLPRGAASQSVTEDGKLQKKKDKNEESDRTVPGQGSIQSGNDDNKDSKDSGEGEESREQEFRDEQGQSNVAEGMEAEEGDFVNLEIAFAYRARLQGRRLKDRAKNAHLYLAFYLPANIKLPVWVELRGLVGTMRVRLQLTPDPPFISLCTLTFLGQPKVDMSCTPLTKKGLNIMDLPLISNFVQSAVDAAMAEYVAPKSLTLDLKDMLVGDDFKKDTSARGVMVVRIKYAFDFKEGDPGIMLIKSGSSDPYVSVGWAKFGKPVWSTRVILSDMHPYWEETAFVLVGPNELNVDERLRLQLWDSDRTTADDDLGRIEVDLKELMRDERSNGKMWDRQDGFRALKAGEHMPGRLEWSVGYYSKTRILASQIKQQTILKDVNTIEDLKRVCNDESERKLREAKASNQDDIQSEIDQQKAQDFKARQDELVISVPPPDDYPSGILSIVIHQITGLELEAINKRQADEHQTESDEQEEGEDLPSSYCNIILNHQKVFMTRTKPKNAKPFFNAGCERFVRDWRTCQVHIAVRDARVHEDDSLLGIVHLPLKDVLSERSQIDQVYPLSGGMGYGRIRISMVFRTVQLQASPSMLGWEYGTLDINPTIKGQNLPADLTKCKIKARTKLGKGKFQYKEAGQDGQIWAQKRNRPVRIAVHKRYSSCLVLEFSNTSGIFDKVPGFAILWLQEIPDEEEKTLKLKVYKGDMKRAEANVLPEKEYGEAVGEIELTLTYWSGLSPYHSMLASKDQNIANVFEVLDAANDLDEEDGVDGNHDDSDSSSSSSDSDSDEDVDAGATDDKGNMAAKKKAFREEGKKIEKNDLESDGKRGPMDQIKDYKTHQKQLHRKNRGLMQWKGPRTMKWMAGKIERGEQKVAGLFSHHQRESGIETEV